MTLPLLQEDLIKRDLRIEDIDNTTKSRLGKYGLRLLGLAINTVDLSKKYLEKQAEPKKTSVFDFRRGRLFLWSIREGKEPELKIKNQNYGCKGSRVCVGINHIAAKNGFFGKPVKVWIYTEEVSKMFSAINSSYVNNCFKREQWSESFGYEKEGSDTLTVTYVPEGIVL